MGRGRLGCPSSPLRLPHSIPFLSLPLQGSAPPSELFSHLHPGDCSCGCGGRSAGERGYRACLCFSRVYSHLFVTPKVTGGWHPVIDLSSLNSYVDVSHFHMETAHSVLQSLRLGDWMVSLDLQDAYLQVPVHPSSRRFLRYCVGDSVYQFRSLCFGLATAPQVFTRVMAPVSSIMHRFGFRILYSVTWTTGLFSGLRSRN